MNDQCFENFINQDFETFSDWLFSLNAYEFTAIATLIGFIISPTLTLNQQNSLGNFFELLGQVILTINAQGTTLRQHRNEKPGIKEKLEKITLEEEIINIKKEVIKLRKDVLNNEKE